MNYGMTGYFDSLSKLGSMSPSISGASGSSWFDTALGSLGDFGGKAVDWLGNNDNLELLGKGAMAYGTWDMMDKQNKRADAMFNMQRDYYDTEKAYKKKREDAIANGMNYGYAGYSI